MRLLVIILWGMFLFIGHSMSFADGDNSSADSNDRMQAINQALNSIEESQQPQENNAAALTPIVVNPPANPSVSQSPAVIPPPVAIKGPVPRENELEFAIEDYSARYEQPKIYSQNGSLAGYAIEYTHRFPQDIMAGIQAQWSDGKFKQPPDQGYSGIKDRLWEIRGIIGHDYYLLPKTRLTPYSGVGFRYLEDNSEGLTAEIDGGTILGFKAYSHYTYLPFGADFVYEVNPHFNIKTNLEYDYMVHGWQVDKYGVYPGFDTLKVDQNYGNGLRGSLRFNYELKYATLFAELFYRYWQIPKTKLVEDGGYLLNEPRNTTQEFGLRLGFDV